MIQFIEEGSIIANGLNIYRLRDESSFGFKFRYGPYIPGTKLKQKLFSVRYSKRSKKWFVQKYKIDKVGWNYEIQKEASRD